MGDGGMKEGIRFKVPGLIKKYETRNNERGLKTNLFVLSTVN